MSGSSCAGEHGSLGSLAVGDGSSKEQDVRLGSMDHVVDPALALLNPEAAPLRLAHQLSLGHHLGQVLGQHDVSTREREREREAGKIGKFLRESPSCYRLTCTQTFRRNTCPSSRYSSLTSCLTDLRRKTEKKCSPLSLQMSAFTRNHAPNCSFKSGVLESDWSDACAR